MKRIALIAFALVIGGAAAYALRPICVPLTDEQLAAFETPVEARADRDLHVRVFQQRDGRWHQCKTWLSRQLFF